MKAIADLLSTQGVTGTVVLQDDGWRHVVLKCRDKMGYVKSLEGLLKTEEDGENFAKVFLENILMREL